MDYEHFNHEKYKIKYHIIFSTKYRKKCLKDISEDIKSYMKIAESKQNKWKIEKLLFIIVIFTFLLALFNYIKAKMDSNYFVTQEVSRHRYLKAVSEKVMTCNYYKLESPETQVKINQVGNLVYTGASNVGINGVQNNLKSLIITLLGSFTYIAVLKSLGVVIVILRLINGVGYYWLSGKSDLFVHKNRDSWAVIDKKISYTNDK